LASVLGAQEVVLEAKAIDAAWAGSDGVVRVQCGRTVLVLRDLVERVAIPKEAIAFDEGPCLAWAAAGSFRVGRPSGGDVLSRDGVFPLGPEPGLGPLRAPFFLTDDLVASPTSTGVAILDRRSGGSFLVGGPPVRTQTAASA